MKATWSWTRSWAAAARPSPRSRATGTTWATRSKRHYVRLAEKRIKQFIREVMAPSLLDLLAEDCLTSITIEHEM